MLHYGSRGVGKALATYFIELARCDMARHQVSLPDLDLACSRRELPDFVVTGEMGIIPGCMGTKSDLVRGKGNPESFKSSAHGAGRRTSRHAKMRTFGEAELRRQTEGGMPQGPRRH